MIFYLVVYGLVNSATLALIGIGFSLSFGISGVANFSYGAFYFLSGLLTWLLLNHVGVPLVLASVIAILVSGVLGFVTYWAIILRVRGIMLSEVIATFAMGVGILEFLRWMGFDTHDMNLPVFVKGSLTVKAMTLDFQRLFIVVIGMGLVLFLYMVTHRTRIGLSFRAIAQNERTAISLGVDSDWIAALSLALGSAMAAIAAITILPLGMVSISVGYDVLLTAIAVGIVGGLESVPGIMVASLILGFTQIIAGMYLGSEWMAVVYLAAIVAVLAIKPSGLLGRHKELEERV
jgi:branched-chain amino acid transport system permease protein